MSNGLGTADTGGPWSTTGSSSNFAVSPGAATITVPTAGSTRWAWLGATNRTETDLRLTLSLDMVPSSRFYASVSGRRVGVDNEYQAQLVLDSARRVSVGLAALRGRPPRR